MASGGYQSSPTGVCGALNLGLVAPAPAVHRPRRERTTKNIPVLRYMAASSTRRQSAKNHRAMAMSMGTKRPQRSQLSDERKSPVRSPPSPKLCLKALGLVAVSGFTTVRWLEGTCLELSRLCREEAPWTVKLRTRKMPPGFPGRQTKMQVPENRLVQRRRIMGMVLGKGACINKEGFTWPTGVKKVRFEPFRADLVGTKWPPTVVEIKLCSGMATIKRSKVLKLIPSLKGVVWPENLLVLELLENFFNMPLQDMVFPDTLQDIVLGGEFDQPIEGYKWPASLQHLTLGGCFNRSIAGVQWPPGLRVLKLSLDFNQPLDGVVWPNALRELHFLTGEFGEGYFDQPIDVIPLPRTLEVLKFGSEFNQSIDNIEWPAALREIVVGHDFNGRDSDNLRSVVWPASLRDFTAPVAKLTEKLNNARRGQGQRHQRRQYFRKGRKMRHDDCALCAGRREQRRIDDFRQLGWVPNDCRIHDAYSPLQREDGLGYYDDSCTENENTDEEEREMREVMKRYCWDWGY